jgi:hypothetical protein
VQERTYHEAHATLRVIDGKEKAPLSELVPEDTSAESVAAAKEKQENIATKLSMYLGETRDDRLYVRQARRVTICERSRSGVETEEPGTELIVCVRRERNKESVPTILMQKLAEAYSSGPLAEQLGVSKAHISMFVLTQAKELVRRAAHARAAAWHARAHQLRPIPFPPQVREPPTLVQLRSETEETQASCQKRYEISQAIKPYHKEQARCLPLMTCLACKCSPQRGRLSRSSCAPGTGSRAHSRTFVASTCPAS